MDPTPFAVYNMHTRSSPEMPPSVGKVVVATMNVTIIVLGVAVLVVIAITIGRVADRQARDEAWRRIARERRDIWEQRQALSAGPACQNPDCPYWGGREEAA